MAKKNLSPRSTNQIDAVIARRLRAKREELELSQVALAHLVGVTFQQIQKYENVANRVSASRLFAIAGALGVTVSYFFEPVIAASQATKGRKRGSPKNASGAKGARQTGG